MADSKTNSLREAMGKLSGKYPKEKPSEKAAVIPSVQASGKAEMVEGFANNWHALADALSVEEKTLYNFRQRFAKEIKALGRTLTRADGRHSIKDWAAFADEKGELRGKGLNNPDIDYIDERQLRLRERQLAVETAEHKLKAQKREVLPLVEYQAALRVTVGAFDTALQQLPGRCVEKLTQHTRQAFTAMLAFHLTAKQFDKIRAILETGEIDHSAAMEILDAELEACRLALAGADFLEPEPEEE